MSSARSRVLLATLVLTLGYVSQATAQTTPAHAIWSFGTLGTGIGLSGIVTARNGTHTEIYVGGSVTSFGANTAWYALRYSATTKDYEVVFVSDTMPDRIRQIALMRNGSSALILVALEDGTIRVYDQPTKGLVGTFKDPCSTQSGLTALTTANLDGVGWDEIISSCDNGVLLAYGESYAFWSIANAGGTDMVVAQMDNDPALEIATTNGSIVDVNAKSVQWKRAEGFGALVDAADVDADGRSELIAADAYYVVRAYDVEKQLPKWSVPVDLDVDAILVTDIDGDGAQELLIGDGQWGEVHAYDTATLAEEWKVSNPEHGVTNIAVADVNNDGTLDLLFGSGASSSGPDHLYVADWQARKIVWENLHIDGPFVGPAIGDLDGDGVPEIVLASVSSDSGYDAGRIIVIDSVTLKIRGLSAPIADNYGATGLHDLELRDLDGDGRLEVLVTSDRLSDGVIEVYRFSSSNQFTRIWTNSTRPYGAPFHTVDAADLDGDGDMEIIGGVGIQHSGAIGTFLYVYDYATGAEQWRSMQLGSIWSEVKDIRLVDLDADGLAEIVAMVDRGDIYIFDAQTKEIEGLIETTATAMAPFPVGGGVNALAIGDKTGRLSAHLFDGTTYPEVFGTQLGATALDGIQIEPNGTLWTAVGGLVRRYKGADAWETANYGKGHGNVFAFGALPAGQWLLMTGDHGLHLFVAP